MNPSAPTGCSKSDYTVTFERIIGESIKNEPLSPQSLYLKATVQPPFSSIHDKS